MSQVDTNAVVDETPQPNADPDFFDGSGAIFSMYLERAEEEDRKMVESWKGDADGMLVFVRFCPIFRTFAYNAGIVDWFIFRCCCRTARNICPGHSAELAGHLSFLSRTYLSAALGIERNTSHYPLVPVRSHPAIFSTYIISLGQRVLVLEPLYQPYLRAVVDLASTMGTSLSQGRLPTAKPSQASTNSRILFGGCGEVARSIYGRSITSAAPLIPFPVFRGPWGVLVQCPSHSLQSRHVVDRAMRRRVRIHHVLADRLQGQPLLCAAFYFCLFLSHRPTIWLRTLPG
jgi:Family of unknown function (DUF6535)